MAQRDFTPYQAEQIKKFFRYLPDTGAISLLEARNRSDAFKVGMDVVKASDSGTNIYLNGSRFSAARVAWFLMFGHAPSKVVFKDGDFRNLKLSNLADGKLRVESLTQLRAHCETNGARVGLSGSILLGLDFKTIDWLISETPEGSTLCELIRSVIVDQHQDAIEEAGIRAERPVA